MLDGRTYSAGSQLLVRGRSFRRLKGWGGRNNLPLPVVQLLRRQPGLALGIDNLRLIQLAATVQAVAANFLCISREGRPLIYRRSQPARSPGGLGCPDHTRAAGLS
jgi:hypothetical protein